jgi:hypothetical protein
MPRGGAVVLRLRATVQHMTSNPLIPATLAPGPCVSTEEADIDRRLAPGGYGQKEVWHRRGASARDDDGDGWQAVQVNTMAGGWSRLRAWLRPHRGSSQENLPRYVGFCACVHQVRRRGNALLGALLVRLLTSLPGTQIEPSRFTITGGPMGRYYTAAPARQRRSFGNTKVVRHTLHLIFALSWS